MNRPCLTDRNHSTPPNHNKTSPFFFVPQSSNLILLPCLNPKLKTQLPSPPPPQISVLTVATGLKASLFSSQTQNPSPPPPGTPIREPKNFKSRSRCRREALTRL
ncbi:hypothetical protein COLO4_32725 [Corchorus olitorius]|uniref:Uncharacterized protein n=1 Tax=Corchorus olitorius TaxID=93759 RepID=A0A1R3GY90_9ROSI|nr:hypothetical protein COLO4_32725 [Corchorus olitorius]